MAPVNYAIYGMEEPMRIPPFGEVQSHYQMIDNKPFASVQPRSSRMDVSCLNDQLKHYESYLDDYSHFRRRKLRWIAMKKFSHIMQSIRSKSRDRFQFEYHEEDNNDDDDEDEEEEAHGAITGSNINGRLLDRNNSEHRQQSFNFRPMMGSATLQRNQNPPNWDKIIRKHRSRVRTNQYASQHAFTWGTIAPSNTEQ